MRHAQNINTKAIFYNAHSATLTLPFSATLNNSIEYPKGVILQDYGRLTHPSSNVKNDDSLLLPDEPTSSPNRVI